MDEKLLNALELKTYIKAQARKSKYYIDIVRDLYGSYAFVRKKTDPLRKSDNYTIIYVDHQGYRKYGIGDRGRTYDDEKVYTLQEICFYVLSNIVTRLASRVYDQEKKPAGDWRRRYFQIILEILAEIDPVYYEMQKADFDEVLRLCPYDDNPKPIVHKEKNPYEIDLTEVLKNMERLK